MAAIAVQYTDEVYGQRGYFATWEPFVSIRPGHAGPLENRVFKPQAHISDYGVEFEIDDDGKPADVDYSSEDGLKITFQMTAGNQAIPEIPQGKAGVRLDFTRKEAVAVALKGARQSRIHDQNRLKRALIDAVLSSSGDSLPDNWFVVTDVVDSAFASVVIAQGKDASFSVSGSADFKAGIVDLANASLELSVANENQVGYKLIAHSGATPLFRGIRIRRTILGNLKLESLGPDERSDEQIDEMFESATPETVDPAS